MVEFGPILFSGEVNSDRFKEIAARTEVILRDLHDMVSTWGNRHAQRNDVFVLNPEDFGVKTEILVKAKTDPEDLRLIVKKGSDYINPIAILPFTKTGLVPFVLEARQVIRESPLGISYPETLPRMLVFYDTDLSLEELFNFMAEMMIGGSVKGLLEKGGKRKENPDRKYFVPTKLNVEEVFKDEKSGISILPGSDISELLEEFDRPEELVVVEDPYTGTPSMITHRKWEDYHALKFKVANEVFLEMGINPLDLAQVSTLDATTFEPLFNRVRDEIEIRLKKAWAQRQKQPSSQWEFP